MMKNRVVPARASIKSSKDTSSANMLVKSTDSFFVQSTSGKSISPSTDNPNKRNPRKPYNENAKRTFQPGSSDNSEKYIRIADNVNKRADRTKKIKSGKVEKIPFDKKKWRLLKYSKKYKLEQWEEKRKKAVLREYYQELKDDKPKLDVQKIYEQYEDSDEEAQRKPNKLVQTEKQSTEPKAKHSTNKKVKMELERIQQEKETRKEELAKKKEEREEAAKLYRQKKNEKYKKLNKKTKRGQPVMRGRIEMLLERIQSS